jgi:hypothetical protein
MSADKMAIPILVDHYRDEKPPKTPDFRSRKDPSLLPYSLYFGTGRKPFLLPLLGVERGDTLYSNEIRRHT